MIIRNIVLPLGLSCLLGSTASGQVVGQDHPYPRLSVGGGVVDWSGIGDITFSPLAMGPHLSLGFDDAGEHRYAYGEVAGNYIITVGFGVGHAWASQASTQGDGLFSHAIVGLPLPLAGRWPDRRGWDAVGIDLHGGGPAPILVYAEPFVRWRWEGAFKSHVDTAFGLLLKVSFRLGYSDGG